MKHKVVMYLLVALCASLVSCSNTSNGSTSTPANPASPTIEITLDEQRDTIAEIQTPKTGYASVKGQIHSTVTNGPIHGIFVFLAPVTRQGDEAIFILETTSSPTTSTARDGTFAFRDITPGEYVMVVGDPLGAYRIYTDPTDHPQVWNFPADEISDSGTINVDL